MERTRAETETLAVLAAGEGFYPGPCPSCNGAPFSRCPNCDGEGRIWAQGRAALGGATLDDAGMIRLLSQRRQRVPADPREHQRTISTRLLKEIQRRWGS